MTATEPEPGRRLVETDANSSSVTTFIVDAAADGTSKVTIGTEWQGASGLSGFFERIFAPRVMRSIYADQLRRLDAYAREQAGSPTGWDQWDGTKLSAANRQSAVDRGHRLRAATRSRCQ